MKNRSYSGSMNYLIFKWILAQGLRHTHTWINNKRISFLISLLLERRYIHVKERSLHFWSKQTYLKREKAIWIFCMFHAYMLPIRNCKGYLFTAGWVIRRACERISCSIYCFFLFNLCCLFDNNVGVTWLSIKRTIYFRQNTPFHSNGVWGRYWRRIGPNTKL